MQSFLYKLYLFSLPFEFFLLPPEFWQGLKFGSISTLFLLLGLFVNLVIEKGRIYIGPMKKWTYLYLFMVSYSTVCAIVLYDRLGVKNGETTFDCIIGSFYWYFIAVLSIYYNYISFKKHITLAQFYRVMKLLSFFLLAIGFLQLGVIRLGGSFSTLYNGLAAVLGIRPAEYLLTTGKGITLFTSEPSHVAGVLYVLVPLVAILELKKKIKWHTFLWIFLLFTSGSSQTIISTLVFCLCLVSIYYAKKIHRVFLYGSFCVGMFFAVFSTYGTTWMQKLNLVSSDNLSYLIYGKVLDTSNMSTAMRISTVINDIKIIESYPLTGVGDGIQGFFYNQNIPNWVYISGEVKSVARGDKGIINGGGNFFAAYLSAFGLIGALALCLFLRYYKRDVSLLDESSPIRAAYSVGIVLFLLTGWYVEGFMRNPILPFLLSLPYFQYNPYYRR